MAPTPDDVPIIPWSSPIAEDAATCAAYTAFTAAEAAHGPVSDVLGNAAAALAPTVAVLHDSAMRLFAAMLTCGH